MDLLNSYKTDEALHKLGDVDPGPRRIGGHALRLDATGGGRLARFKQCRQARDPRRGLFEPLFERRKPRPHKEKALQRFRRKAGFEEKSG